MVLNKNSISAAIYGLSAVMILAGLSSFFTDLGGYTIPLLIIVSGLILLSEVGIKKLAPKNLSSLKKLGGTQWVSIILGVLGILNGLLTLPIINVQLEFLNQLAGGILVLIGIFIAVEMVSNK